MSRSNALEIELERNDAQASTTQEQIATCITEAIDSGTCGIVKNSALSWSVENSRTTTFPGVEISKIFTGTGKIQSVVSFVSVEGGRNEQPHAHDSHLLGMVICGRGYLLHARANASKIISTTPITQGDTFIIPRGVSHVLTCKNSEGVSFIALEIADEDIAVGPSSIKPCQVSPKTGSNLAKSAT